MSRFTKLQEDAICISDVYITCFRVLFILRKISGNTSQNAYVELVLASVTPYPKLLDKTSTSRLFQTVDDGSVAAIEIFFNL